MGERLKYKRKMIPVKHHFGLILIKDLRAEFSTGLASVAISVPDHRTAFPSRLDLFWSDERFIALDIYDDDRPVYQQRAC